MLGYLDFFLGGDEKRTDLPPRLHQRFPMSLIFGGDGSYMAPFSLHSDRVVTSLISQVDSVTFQTVPNCWIKPIILNLLNLFIGCTIVNMASSCSRIECPVAFGSSWKSKCNISSCTQMAWNSCKSCVEHLPGACWPCMVPNYSIRLLSVWSCSSCSGGRGGCWTSRWLCN